MLGFLVVEYIADSQQQHFQTHKYKWLQELSEDKPSPNEESDYKLGFLTHGLFTYSRHPAFFCEQAIWVTFYLFSVDFSNIAGVVDDVAKLFTVGGGYLNPVEFCIFFATRGRGLEGANLKPIKLRGSQIKREQI